MTDELDMTNPYDRLIFNYSHARRSWEYIEITKIIKESKNNGDNIFKFLKAVTNEENPKKHEAIKCIEQLNECSEIINSIIGARDKYFAHLDPDFKPYLKSLSLMDINRCFIAIEKGIMILTSKETLLSQLDKIPSRDEFQLIMK
jgi:hypothetical protein